MPSSLSQGLGCRSDCRHFCQGTGTGGGGCWAQRCGEVVVAASSLAGAGGRGSAVAGGDDRLRCWSTGCDACPTLLLHMVEEWLPCRLWLVLVVMEVGWPSLSSCHWPYISGERVGMTLFVKWLGSTSRLAVAV